MNIHRLFRPFEFQQTHRRSEKWQEPHVWSFFRWEEFSVHQKTWQHALFSQGPLEKVLKQKSAFPVQTYSCDVNECSGIDLERETEWFGWQRGWIWCLFCSLSSYCMIFSLPIFVLYMCSFLTHSRGNVQSSSSSICSVNSLWVISMFPLTLWC